MILMSDSVVRLADNLASKNWGVSEYSILALVVGGVFTAAVTIILKVIGNRNLKFGKVEIEKSQSMAAVNESIDLLISKKFDTENRIRMSQKKSIHEFYEEFCDLFLGSDFLVTELLWWHFVAPLQEAADENHILEFLSKNGVLEDEYVDKKVTWFATRFRRLSSKTESIPDWSSELNSAIFSLMANILTKYVRIAEAEWKRWRDDLQSIQLMVKDTDPSIEKRLSKLV